jgi:hypothetical protein
LEDSLDQKYRKKDAQLSARMSMPNESMHHLTVDVGLLVVGSDVGVELGVADGCANMGLEDIILERRIQPHDHVEQINA